MGKIGNLDEDDDIVADLEVKKKPSAHARLQHKLKVYDIDASADELEETNDQAQRKREFSEAFNDGSKLTTKQEILPDGSVVLTKTWSPPKLQKESSLEKGGDNKIVPIDFNMMMSSDEEFNSILSGKGSKSKLPPIE